MTLSRVTHGSKSGVWRAHAPPEDVPALALVDGDRELVAQIRGGDETAFTFLFRTHHAPLCSYAYRIVNDPEVAQDLVQAALFGVWRHRERWELRPGGTVRAYLYAAVRNIALQYHNHERVVHRAHDSSLRGGRGIAMGRGAGAADDNLATRDLATAFAAALDGLPPRCREAFVLRRGAGLSVAEVARVMQVAPKTVEVQIGAALRLLRAELRDWTGWSPGLCASEASAPVHRAAVEKA